MARGKVPIVTRMNALERQCARSHPDCCIWMQMANEGRDEKGGCQRWRAQANKETRTCGRSGSGPGRTNWKRKLFGKKVTFGEIELGSKKALGNRIARN